MNTTALKFTVECKHTSAFDGVGGWEVVAAFADRDAAERHCAAEQARSRTYTYQVANA